MVSTQVNFCTWYQQLLDDIKATDLHLSHVHMENEDLKLKLEASREAGAISLRGATRWLFDVYQTQLDETRRKYGQEKQALQQNVEDWQQNLATCMTNIDGSIIALQEKEYRVLEKEKLIERMKKEKKVLMERKEMVEKNILWKLSQRHCSPIIDKSLMSSQRERSTLRDQIIHLDHVILDQDKIMRGYIFQIDRLKKELLFQDESIANLHERLHSLEAQNKELKYLVNFWSSHCSKKISRATNTNPTPRLPHYPLLDLVKLPAPNR
ncbi:coiled-coil domain-containing protein 68-like [Polypterus senegalus]|uniref:coiled-coil domain-containing protein 68-like n=1 Tax=Polypterus senegalus TaxID=55291 RepID=UPI0019625E6B|nr:coiled-coil domain-containing protein 68-like [Polypterus senegalus]